MLTSIDEKIATGETWLGYDAIHLQLIDEILTSDEYITQRIVQDHVRVVKLIKVDKKKGTNFFFPFFQQQPTTQQQVESNDNQIKVSSAEAVANLRQTLSSVVFGDIPLLLDCVSFRSPSLFVS